MVQFSDGLGRLIRVDEIVRLNDDGTPSGTLNTWTTRYQYDLNDRAHPHHGLPEQRQDHALRGLQAEDVHERSGLRASPPIVYDEASNLIETIDAKSQRITYTYDGANRILTEDYHDENSPEFSYHRSPDVAYSLRHARGLRRPGRRHTRHRAQHQRHAGLGRGHQRPGTHLLRRPRPGRMDRQTHPRSASRCRRSDVPSRDSVAYTHRLSNTTPWIASRA